MLNAECVSRSQLLLQYLMALSDSDDFPPAPEISEPEVKEN
jgi:hypothetical protein